MVSDVVMPGSAEWARAVSRNEGGENRGVKKSEAKQRPSKSTQMESKGIQYVKRQEMDAKG